MKFRLSTKTITFIVGFTIYAYFMYVNYPLIVQFIRESSIFMAILAYILFNPAYLLIIYGVWNRFRHRRIWKRAIASIISILSLDFLAVPRLSITDSLTNGSAITTNIGSIVMRGLENFVSHEFAYQLMYLVLPVLGLIISVELLGITNFIRENAT